MRTTACFALSLLIAGTIGCKRKSRSALHGQWRAVLHSPGGELPFGLELAPDGAYISNASERIGPLPFELSGSALTIEFPHYDAKITATVDGDLSGEWTKRTAEGHSRLAFSARRGSGRFARQSSPAIAGAPATVAGRWRTEFRDSDGVYLAVGELEQSGDRVIGTFLTATGDYRFLEGDYVGGRLRLSTFDGAHAFLFAAEVRGAEMTGTFWSRDVYRALLVARPVAAGEEVLPNAFNEVRVTSADRRLRFSFTDLDGEIISHDAPRFRGKVVLIDIFGTWCPNCNDAAPLLADWHRRYRAKGLEVVGLAFEYTGDRQRDLEMLRRYRERHGVEYPLLLAGTSDKSEASEVLSDLSAVKSYPTHVFIARDGKVRTIHSGFAGPGTGSHHQRLVRELEDEIRSLLVEREPDGVN